jgi:hypothetical protein
LPAVFPAAVLFLLVLPVESLAFRVAVLLAGVFAAPLLAVLLLPAPDVSFVLALAVLDVVVLPFSIVFVLPCVAGALLAEREVLAGLVPVVDDLPAALDLSCVAGALLIEREVFGVVVRDVLGFAALDFVLLAAAVLDRAVPALRVLLVFSLVDAPAALVLLTELVFPCVAV